MFDTCIANPGMNMRDVNLTGDVIFVHDPQPARLIPRKKEIGRGWGLALAIQQPNESMV